MPLPRRHALLLPALLAPAGLQAQPAWPTQSLRLIVPSAGGAGTGDTLARLFAQGLEARLGQRVVVDNRPGANGNVGATAAARAAPDGTTFLWSWAGTLATNPALQRNLPYDPQRDFAPVLLAGNVPNILVVNRDLGPRTLQQFTQYARENPGTLNYGSSGNGSSMHLAGQLYQNLTGTSMTHVPYTSPAAAMTDLFSGRIQCMFNLLTGATPQIRAGEVVPIAVLSDRRVPQLPEVPSVAELDMPGLAFGTWFAVLAPRGTDATVVARLNALGNEVLREAETRGRLEAAGMEVLGGPPERLGTLLAEEITRHAELVRSAGVRID